MRSWTLGVFFIFLVVVTGEMRFVLGLDSGIFPEVPHPIAMAVPTSFSFYKMLIQSWLPLSTFSDRYHFCRDRGITLSRLRDAVPPSPYLAPAPALPLQLALWGEDQEQEQEKEKEELIVRP